MIKSRFARWFSVIVVGALAVGCGSRGDGRANGSQAQAPAACVPPPADTLKPPSGAAAAAAVSAGATASPVASAPGAKDSKGAQDAKGAKDSKDAKVVKVVTDAPLKVKRLVLADDIARERREPVGEKASFKAAELDKIYAFVEVENPTKSESEVFVTFEPQGDGASQGQVSLRVGASSRWRTWAYTRGVKKAGAWAAVVRSADGKVLAKTPFEVTL